MKLYNYTLFININDQYLKAQLTDKPFSMNKGVTLNKGVN